MLGAIVLILCATRHSVNFICKGARGGEVGWGTALQAGSSQDRFPTVSLEFFINKFLLTTSPTSCGNDLEMEKTSTSWSPQAVPVHPCTGTALSLPVARFVRPWTSPKYIIMHRNYHYKSYGIPHKEHNCTVADLIVNFLWCWPDGGLFRPKHVV
jgi:hypothetical protein